MNQPVGSQTIVVVEAKSHLVAYLLWFFLGWLGVHRLYWGKILTGILQLGLFVFGALTVWILGLGLVFWVPLGLWWLLDVILIALWRNPPQVVKV
jgi:TM2 domain-containing membrane protein YozV